MKFDPIPGASPMLTRPATLGNESVRTAAIRDSDNPVQSHRLGRPKLPAILAGSPKQSRPGTGAVWTPLWDQRCK